MDVKEKIMNALSQALKPEFIRLEDGDGVTGFIVSRQFEGMSSLDRQARIEDVLNESALTQDEHRQVLMIAALTPLEYETVGARIRVHRVREMAGGVEILLHGGMSDADYVRGVLAKLKGVRTYVPEPVPGALGVLMCFQAKGTEAAPLTKKKALRLLKKDPYVEVMPNA